jgi:multiple sugar transport system substrate-binding protein
MSNDEKLNLIGRGLDRRRFLQTAAATLAAPALASLPATVARADDTVTLTYWAWTPGNQEAVDAFMKKYPNIKINWQNVGQGGPHYVKLRDAIKAGTGLPDVAQMEFNSIPSFKALNALADMGTAGANAVKDKFVDWTWKSVSDGDKVYGIPWDSGPMGLLYRTDVFDDNKLTVPETWDDFADTAMKLSKDKPGTFLTDFGAADAGWIAAMLWQAGWRPFHLEGTNIHIQLNDPIAKNWAAYWQKLIDAKAVDTAPVWTTEWFAGLDSGKYAAWVTAAWGPVLMVNSMKASIGKWHAAPMPQWKKGDKIVSNWGGSTFATFTTSPHLKEATQFAIFMGSDPDTAKFWNQKEFLFPVLKELLDDKELMGTKYDFYGGQAVNQVFVEAENEVDPSFEFAPFQDFVNTQIQDELAASIGGKGTLSDAFDRVHATIVAYATDQGYTVV